MAEKLPNQFKYRMANIKDTLSSQIATAEALLQKAMAIPDGEPSTMLAGFIRYDEKYTRPLTIETDGWETETKEILIVLYGEVSRQVDDFLACTRKKHHFTKFREELQEELNRCIAFLKALIKADEMIQQMAVQKSDENVKKPPMVFISHSSKDKDFAEALVDLLESLGLDSETVFCSSVDGYGVGLGKDIFETLLNLFRERDLYVIFLQSPRYYLSSVSLNEMGAAWVLKTDCCSVLTSDMERSMMTGVVDGSTIYIKVNNEDASSRINELKEKLSVLFNLSPQSQTTWERKRNKFLSAVNALQYPEVKSTEEKTQIDQEYKKLQIAKMKQEAEDRKKALIFGEVYKTKGGSRTLSIYNRGMAKAKNLHIEVPNSEQIYASNPELPCDIDGLRPNDHRDFMLYLSEGDDELTLVYSWEDEFSKENKEEQTLDL